jgi:hypothetical protein
MSELYTPRAVHRDDPAIGAVAINYAAADQTPEIPVRGFYITSGTTLVVTMLDGSTATLSGLIPGTVYWIGIRGITKAASTAAGYLLR